MVLPGQVVLVFSIAEHRVVAVAAYQNIVLPAADELVVAVTAVEDVIAMVLPGQVVLGFVVAPHPVVAGAACQDVVLPAADELVVAVAAVEDVIAVVLPGQIGLFGIAPQQIVAGSSKQDVVSAAAVHFVVVGAAVEIVAAVILPAQVGLAEVVTPHVVVAVPTEQAVVSAAADELVVAGAAIEDVVAVLGLQQALVGAEADNAVAVEQVVAIAAIEDVVAAVAPQDIVVVTAVEIVVAEAADNFVVAVFAEGDVACAVLARRPAAFDGLAAPVVSVDAPQPATGPHGTRPGRRRPVVWHAVVVAVALRLQIQPGGGKDHVAAGAAVDEVAAGAAGQKVVAQTTFEDVVAAAAVKGVVAGQAEHVVCSAATGEAVAVAVGAGDDGGRSRRAGAAHVETQLPGLPALDAKASVAAVLADDEDLVGAAALEGVGDAVGGVFPDVGGSGDQGAAAEGEAVEDDGARTVAVEDGVGAVAGVEEVGVVARATFEVVVAAASGEGVVSIASVQPISLALSCQGIVVLRTEDDEIEVSQGATHDVVYAVATADAHLGRQAVDDEVLEVERCAALRLDEGVAHGGGVIKTKLQFPRQHGGAVLEILVGEHALAGGGVVAGQFAVGVDAAIEGAAAGDGEGVEFVEGVAVGHAVRGVGHGQRGYLAGGQFGQGREGQRGEGAGVPPGLQALQVAVIVVSAGGRVT